jgi:hypothetical protein
MEDAGIKCIYNIAKGERTGYLMFIIWLFVEYFCFYVTGKCAALIEGRNRCLIADIAAASKYDVLTLILLSVYYI